MLIEVRIKNEYVFRKRSESRDLNKVHYNWCVKTELGEGLKMIEIVGISDMSGAAEEGQWGEGLEVGRTRHRILELSIFCP